MCAEFGVEPSIVRPDSSICSDNRERAEREGVRIDGDGNDLTILRFTIK